MDNFDFYNTEILINTSEIINVVRNALSKIDPRLIDHGERVAYVAKSICDADGKSDRFDMTKLFILCIFHDIGAYKTDEIDDMVKFETEHPLDHSRFGYLFLKHTTKLGDYAEAILYHHTDYDKMESKNCRYAEYAELIHLADRIDILAGMPKADFSVLKHMSGKVFNPEFVDAFFKAETAYGIIEKLHSEKYKSETEIIVRSMHIKSAEIIDYIKLIVFALDFRSPFTVTHTSATTLISIETGKMMGLIDRDLQILYTGAFFHDIGKIAVPYALLEKPARLTAEEFEQVKRHIPEGEDILRGVISDEICDVALRHHEKLDGSGYSRGLSAKDLTLSQRIVAIADLVSALSQRRPYKEPFCKEKVISILNGMKDDGLICPTVTETVCNNYDLILKNTEYSQDPVSIMYANLMKEYAVLAQSV